MEIKRGLKILGVAFEKYEPTIRLYRKFAAAVKQNKEKAAALFKGGIPDAAKTGVEFKAGIDSLRAQQLVADILRGRKSRVRWFPSWDSLELMLEGKKKDESTLFGSYFSFIKWTAE
jgi:phytoene dehydrogenase-like protein